jgi:DegV family protein with EDD domain
VIRRFFRLIINIVRDYNRDLTERVFVVFTLISEATLLAALIGDILIGENLIEIIILAVTAVCVPFITTICIVKDKLKLATGIIVVCLVALILPGIFIFGGGTHGGGVLWFFFAFMYIGLVLSGKWRTVMLALLHIVAAACFTLEFLHPELINVHTHEMFIIDSFISLLLVGVVCFFMSWFQSYLLKAENERAKKETERAEELSLSQNRFFSSMSHEIRTPINSILGLNELILRDPNATEEIAKDASGIQGAGKMLLALINDILDFSKIEAGSMDIVPVDYRVGDMISEIVNMIWLRANDKGLKFEVNIDPTVPSILYGDEVRIKQIIINLLNNAVKYTQEGSVELYIEREDTDGDEVILGISVIDTGMGIKKENIPHLFDAFKRVDEEKNRYIEGSGLGLSIVKQLVDLMGGTITVNSVYGEGTTFNVLIRQGVSNTAEIGELNIHSSSTGNRSRYEAGFKAPEARILIVDDNEMNLKVEARLLKDTGMTIDTVKSGREALDMTVRNRYDVILMDHLMPEMDGIECLKAVRNQAGGMNRTSPIIALTANAGSDSRELYNHSGFDGYLVKPVSGDGLEETLIKHISSDKLTLSGRTANMREDIKTSDGYSGKAQVVITSSSMCDLPDRVIKKLNIPIIPFRVRTEEGIFKDGLQMTSHELLSYMDSGKKAISSPPDEEAFTEFFASSLKKAHNLIHISISGDISKEYRIATEAAKSFDNVIVINSGSLSSATGLMVLVAHKLAQQNLSVPEIVEELEKVKKSVRCSFVMDTTEYMEKHGLVSHFVTWFTKTLNLHPCVRVKKDHTGLGGVWLGSTMRAYKRYISYALPFNVPPDPDVVFVTYADVPVETLKWFREEMLKVSHFEHIIYKQASAAISSNCGPGTIGILYLEKSEKSYNLSSFIEDEKLEYDVMEENELMAEGMSEADFDFAEEEADVNRPWYCKIGFIDGDVAIRNSGSEESFKTVLKIFYESIEEKANELEEFFNDGDWQNFTIKVHALKSSAKLIGAVDFSERALELEMAGKEANIAIIRDKARDFLSDYRHFADELSVLFGCEIPENVITTKEKPVADKYILESVYEGLREAAENMSCDGIEDILKEIADYRIPDEDEVKLKAIKEMSDQFDYDAILEILGVDPTIV